MTGHYQARHDRSRLIGLFDAALDIHATMGQEAIRHALEDAASELLRSPDAAVVTALPTEAQMSARLRAAVDEERWLVVSGRSAAEPFDEADRSLLEALTAVGSGALQNASSTRSAAVEQERLVALTSSLGEGVCAFDLAGAVTFLNPAAEAMLGCERAARSSRRGRRGAPARFLQPALARSPRCRAPSR